jgi:hypothetical protein
MFVESTSTSYAAQSSPYHPPEPGPLIKGSYTWSSGTVYDGEFKREGQFYLRHGKGKLNVVRNGNVYDGEWVDNKIQGRGTFKWGMGNVYDGEWKNDKMHGKGTYTWSNGDVYKGEYENGKEHGSGVLTFADGDVYDGKWKDGKEHGRGHWSYANGINNEGEWEDGVMVTNYTGDLSPDPERQDPLSRSLLRGTSQHYVSPDPERNTPSNSTSPPATNRAATPLPPTSPTYRPTSPTYPLDVSYVPLPTSPTFHSSFLQELAACHRLLELKNKDLVRFTETVNEKNKEIAQVKKMAMTCIACRDVLPCVAILPCWHMSSCVDCTAKYVALEQPCPMCRGPITSTKKILVCGAVD